MSYAVYVNSFLALYVPCYCSPSGLNHRVIRLNTQRSLRQGLEPSSLLILSDVRFAKYWGQCDRLHGFTCQRINTGPMTRLKLTRIERVRNSKETSSPRCQHVPQCDLRFIIQILSNRGNSEGSGRTADNDCSDLASPVISERIHSRTATLWCLWTSALNVEANSIVESSPEFERRARAHWPTDVLVNAAFPLSQDIISHMPSWLSPTVVHWLFAKPVSTLIDTPSWQLHFHNF